MTWLGSIAQQAAAQPTEALTKQISALGKTIEQLSLEQAKLAQAAGLDTATHTTRLDIFHGYIGVFIAAFSVTLLATPIMRRLAVKHGIIDKPDEARKIHRLPIAYLGGVAVFLGLVAGILLSYIGMLYPNSGIITWHTTSHITGDDPSAMVPFPVPPSILFGMTIIMLVGLIDDVIGIEPRLKIAGQLTAAAVLAFDNVGVQVAKGVLSPTLGKWLGNHDLIYNIPIPFDIPFVTHTLATGTAVIHLDIIYWTGAAIIGLFVLGACNASNLIDGLDGLLTGITGICATALLIIALTLAVLDDGPRDAQRVVLCMALLGACLGFLPYNFNPAVIFLGDSGSLLLGFSTIVIILSLGDTGKTHLVMAGLIIYAIPIIDTCLAIVRRRLAGKSMSEPDSDHLHHMLKRALGVKGAVLVLYAIGMGFGGLGVAMSLWKARVAYALAGIFITYIGVTSIKIARRQQIEAQAAGATARPSPPPRSGRPGHRNDTLPKSKTSSSRPTPAAASGPIAKAPSSPSSKAS